MCTDFKVEKEIKEKKERNSCNSYKFILFKYKFILQIFEMIYQLFQ